MFWLPGRRVTRLGRHAHVGKGSARRQVCSGPRHLLCVCVVVANLIGERTHSDGQCSMRTVDVGVEWTCVTNPATDAVPRWQPIRAGVGSNTTGSSTAAAGANATSASSPSSTALSALPTNGAVLLPGASDTVRIGNSTTALSEPLAKGPYLQGWTELQQHNTMSVSAGRCRCRACRTHCVLCRTFWWFRDRFKMLVGRVGR